ncbi:MAG: hypothetical protein PF542_03320 [Nanoarchaeota archaeon]|jgi:hypothetical protein|nr:hypothetical protein [Nanoarchaeota archaeon]
MTFFGIGKKKTVAPSELPDLISDEIEKESGEELHSFLNEQEKVVVEPKVSESLDKKEMIVKAKPIRDNKTNSQIVEKLVRNIEETEERPTKKVMPSIRKSFFSDLQKDISKEISDMNELDKWYDNRFSSSDVLDDMKTYWNKQKKQDVLEVLGQDFQKRINEKISKLQEVEKKWQSIYFDLVEVEEEIKDEEKGLKDLLKDFAKICKHKKKNLDESSENSKQSGEENEKNKKQKGSKKK